MGLIIRFGAFAVLLSLGLWVTGARADTVWPPQDPDAWGLAIIDVETTGLDPAYHEMIDLGVIYTTLEGEELGRFHVLIMPDHPERLSPGAAAVNGFSVARWEAEGAVSEAVALDQFKAFHSALAGERTVLMLGFNAHFDRAFLDALLAQHGLGLAQFYTYFMLDVPSMAWGAGIRDLSNPRIAAALGIAPETEDPLEHTGLTGVAFNLALYRALLARQAQ